MHGIKLVKNQTQISRDDMKTIYAMLVSALIKSSSLCSSYVISPILISQRRLTGFSLVPRLFMTTTNVAATSSQNEFNPSPLDNTAIRVALLQFKVSESKSKNFEKASDFLALAASNKATLAVLPEIWNGPYATSAFEEYAEVLPNVGEGVTDIRDDVSKCPSAKLLMEKAIEHKMWIVGGSVSERVIVEGDSTNKERIYNTCLCINPDGVIVAKHRKVHLFDIDVPGKITFRESDTLTPGTGLTDFDAGPLGRIGVGICYDIRFPELAQCLMKRGCKILIFPGAFNLITGPAHWELLQRARAVDGQCFVLTASPARSSPPSSSESPKYPHYAAWGHSTAVSPWGEVIATCDEKEQVVYADLNLGEADEMRRNIPTMTQKRDDLYALKDLHYD